MKWERVTDPRALENGGRYVAVGADVGGLKMLEYGKERVDFHTSSKSPTRYAYHSFLLHLSPVSQKLSSLSSSLADIFDRLFV